MSLTSASKHPGATWHYGRIPQLPAMRDGHPGSLHPLVEWQDLMGPALHNAVGYLPG